MQKDIKIRRAVSVLKKFAYGFYLILLVGVICILLLAAIMLFM